MKIPVGPRVTLKVPGIAGERSKDRFLYFIAQRCTVKKESNKGSHVSLHLRIPLADRSPCNVILFANDTVTVSSTPTANSSSFGTLVKVVEEIARLSSQTRWAVTPLVMSRANDLIEFVQGLDTSIELRRMAAVVLSDTANEIVLREKLRSHSIGGSALDEGIPDKIKLIEKKGEPVYRKDEVINVRQLRNKVVHEGIIPTKKEADEVVRISTDFVERA